MYWLLARMKQFWLGTRNQEVPPAVMKLLRPRFWTSIVLPFGKVLTMGPLGAGLRQLSPVGSVTTHLGQVALPAVSDSMVLALLARKLPLLLATGTASVRFSFKIEPTREGQLTPPVIVQVAVRGAGRELETGRCSFRLPLHSCVAPGPLRESVKVPV